MKKAELIDAFRFVVSVFFVLFLIMLFGDTTAYAKEVRGVTGNKV